MALLGMMVVVHNTFVKVKPQEPRCDRRRVCSDSLVCYDNASQVDLYDPSSASTESLATPSPRTPARAWGCEELDFDDAASSCPEESELPALLTLGCASPITPPGIFHGASLLGRRPPVSEGHSHLAEQRTTIMLRNLPSSFRQDQLLRLLESSGFAERFDFVYLPVDFASGACLGFAFVNLISSEDALLVIGRLQGWSSWCDSSCHKVLQLSWSDPHQGLDMLIDRYRNSRIMHKNVPSEYKPLIFKAGEQVPFPGPTKRLRSPL